MSGLRTFLLLLSAALWVAPEADAAAQGSLARDVANCSGRLSAMVEHAWLMRDPGADVLERDRDAFLGILEAIGLERDADTLNLRIDAKAAMKHVLTRASFGEDPALAAVAAHQAAADIATCRLMLLGG